MMSSSYYHYNAHHNPVPSSAATNSSHAHHGGRSRRAPRLSTSQNSQRQFRGVRSMKDMAEQPQVTNFRVKFEAGRSFDLDDDLEFCPNLLTESDLISINSSSSDRSSSSGSPESSPTQQPQEVAPRFSLNSNTPSYIPGAAFHSSPSTLKIHQPAATRIRNAIPIVNPSTGISMSSPPQSVSPGRMHQPIGRRW